MYFVVSNFLAAPKNVSIYIFIKYIFGHDMDTFEFPPTEIPASKWVYLFLLVTKSP